MRHLSLTVILFTVLTALATAQQQIPNQVPTSVDAKVVLDAAGPKQRTALSAILLIVCPPSSAGTGFEVKAGFVVTNAHVVGTCNKDNLFGILNSNERISFTKIITDSRRDLALLIPAIPLRAIGLDLYTGADPVPGETVSTWGYPLLYNGATPLLSVGYVSGFRQAEGDTGGTVKHIVVNAAFNHGNSGGPLLRANDNEVLGVVVLTYHFHPPVIKQIIDAMSRDQFGMMYNFTNDKGERTQISEGQLTAAVLDEFYQTTQVMIGEAISVNELEMLIRERSADLK